MNKISLLLIAVAMLAVGCVEQYPNNARLGMLYKMLNYETSFKERTLFFEMEDYGELVEGGEFYIMGGGISTPGSYVCSPDENVVSAITKANQVSSYSDISFTLIRGIGNDEREIKGMALSAAGLEVPDIEPGDLIYLKTIPRTVALSQK